MKLQLPLIWRLMT
uniref:Uncharacterized protein n=1 Tax=Anguilla anguilla TaxID=7936 RepID=A0A0E9QR97_ANGAN